MAARKFRIPTDTADALRTDAAYDGPRVTITRQLSADEWRGVKSVLEKLGAEYVTGASAFEFEPDQDARPLVMAALADGHVMAASASHGFVATPDTLAADLVDAHAEMTPVPGRKLRVLEPSAGRGAFVRAVIGDADPEDLDRWLHVTAVEVDARRARYIEDGPAVSTVVDRFETWHGKCAANGWTYDRIVMNPPFSMPGRPMAWADHLLLAWELLAPGGRLVAIVPAAVLHPRRDRRHTAVRELIEQNGGAVDLERDAFAASGFMVQTAVVWLDRPVLDQVDPASSVLAAYNGRENRFDVYPHTGAEVPVEVDRPIFTHAAALHTPVQAWRDSWRNAQRVARYVADCCECGRATWAFDDGENDPRGVLGEAAAHPLHAAEYDRQGPSVGFCFLCANTDADTYGRAVSRAMARWREIEEAPEPVADGVYVSPWSLVDVV